LGAVCTGNTLWALQPLRTIRSIRAGWALQTH
jgi:hypothetical protein